MRWEKINPKCLESEDKRWTILKFKRGEEMRYALIRLGNPSQWEFEGATAQECKERADELLRIAA